MVNGEPELPPACDEKCRFGDCSRELCPIYKTIAVVTGTASEEECELKRSSHKISHTSLTWRAMGANANVLVEMEANRHPQSTVLERGTSIAGTKTELVGQTQFRPIPFTLEHIGFSEESKPLHF